MSAIIKQEKPGVAVLVAPEHAGLVALTIRDVASEIVRLGSAESLIGRVRAGRVHAIVVSSAHILNGSRAVIADVTRRYPDVVVAGWMTERETDIQIRAAMMFGAAGARYIIRADGNIAGLRDAVCAAGAADPFIAHAMHTIQDVGTRDGWRRFVATMFHEDTMTVRDVGRVLDVHHSTIGSRFNRARLATPKRLLAYVRLIAAARLLEHPDATIDDVSARLGHSSSQSFGRHIRKLIGMTAVQFRDRFNGAAMLGKTMRDLIEPHRDRLATFDPFHGES